MAQVKVPCLLCLSRGLERRPCKQESYPCPEYTEIPSNVSALWGSKLVSGPNCLGPRTLVLGTELGQEMALIYEGPHNSAVYDRHDAKLCCALPPKRRRRNHTNNFSQKKFHGYPELAL